MRYERMPQANRRPVPAALLGALALVGAVLCPSPAEAQIIRDKLWVTNGIVLSVAYSNNMVYMGGSFTQVGPATGGLVAIDRGSAAVLKPYPEVVGSVYAVAPDGSGGWYIGGFFSAVLGQPRNNLAQIDASGNLTVWDPNANEGVNAIAVSGSTVYVGGRFTNVGGQPRNYIAALDGASGAATGWNPNANSHILGFAVDGGTVYVGGIFTSIGGQMRNYIAALDAATGGATSFNPNANSWVYALSVIGNTLYVGGTFTTISAQPRSRLAAIDVTNGSAGSWNPNVGGNVYALAVAALPTSITIYIAGEFLSIGAQLRNQIGAVDGSTGAPTSFNPNSNGRVYGLALGTGLLSVNTVYAAGEFTNIGGQPRNYLAALNPGTGAATAWDPKPNYPAQTLALAGANIYAGGFFSSVGCQPRNNIAAFDATGGEASTWNPNSNGTVFSLLVDGNTVYAGGFFANIGGQARNSLAALDALTGLATSWNPNAGTDGTVYDMALDAGTLYAAGAFSSMGGLPRGNIAAIDAATGAVSGFNPNVNGAIQALRVVGSFVVFNPPKVFVGGNFTSVGVQPRNNIAWIDGDTGLATAWNPNANSGVNSLIVLANVNGTVSRVYAGGHFTNIGGQPRNRIAALNAAGTATGWDPNASFPVWALALNGGTLYVGGVFSSIGGQPRKCLAAIDATTGLATDWNPFVGGPSPAGNNPVYALAVYSRTIYAGGNFKSLLGLPHTYFAGISDGVVTGVEELTTAAPRNWLRAAPNPFSSSATLRFSLAEAGEADVAVYDLSGRLVRRLHHGSLNAGQQSLVWDGRNDEGRKVGSGVYFLRVHAASQSMTSRIFRLK